LLVIGSGSDQDVTDRQTSNTRNASYHNGHIKITFRAQFQWILGLIASIHVLEKNRPLHLRWAKVPNFTDCTRFISFV